MGRKYRNPPLIEAVCEFKFSETPTWDVTLPGLIYSRIRDVFPIREKGIAQEVITKKSEEGMVQELQMSELAILYQGDKRSFVRIGNRHISIHILKPYDSWSKYQPLILKVYNAFCEEQPDHGIDRIGLRYVNRIAIPQPHVDLDEFFEFSPKVGNKLPQIMDEFRIFVKFTANELNDTCRIRFSSAPSDSPDNTSFVLDLDYVLENPASIQIPQGTLDWVSQAHTKIETFFEGCITNKAREIFGEVKE